MKRTFRFDAGMDVSVTIEVDLDVLTVAMATEINEFWIGSEDVLDASNGDVIVAAARRAASRLMNFLLDDHGKEGSVRELCQCEGWPPLPLLGMRVTDFEIPDFDSADLAFHEVKSPS